MWSTSFLPSRSLYRLGMAGSLVLLGALGGCAQSGGPPPVQEASLNQSAMADGIYHVQRGDTLYSIGWKTGVDYRRIAELNNLQPPYDIDPGQALRISQNASLADSGGGAGQAGGGSGTRAIAMNGSDGSTSGGGDDSWLAPDDSAIERNRSSAGGGAAQGAAGGMAAEASAASSGGSAAGSSGASAATSGGGQSAGRQNDTATQDAVRNSSAASRESSTAQASGVTPPPAASQDRGGTAVAGSSGNDNDRSDRTYAPAQNINWQWPTEGSVVGQFTDPTNITAGIDIAGQKGQPVKAAGPGIVVYAGDGVRGYGNLVILKHNDQFLSAYAHNDTLNVEENDVVRQGETIATMGSTDADSVKLHFEIRQDGQPRDPLQYLPDR